MCGRLLKSMYEARGAVRNRGDCHVDVARDIGFTGGVASPRASEHEARRLRMAAHGDDFALLGSDVDLNWCEEEIEDMFEVKIRGG